MSTPSSHTSFSPSGWHRRPEGRVTDLGRLLLTHVPAWADAEALLAEAREEFDGPAELVVPDGVYRI